MPTDDESTDIALQTIAQGKQALLFAMSKASAEKAAEDVALMLKHAPKEQKYQELAKEALSAISTPTKQCRRLAMCLLRGIAFHHAGLHAKQRELVESEFRKGTVKIICATPTLAMGVSTPAFRVIMKSLKRYGEEYGMDWIPVLEYLQMAGRAGRPEFHEHGEALAIAKSGRDKEEIYERYICGVPEDILSKLAVEPVFRTHLLGLITADLVRSEAEILAFFNSTFWAHQYKDKERIEYFVLKTLAYLEEHDFVLQEKKGNTILVRPTLLGRRTAELYLDPVTAVYLLEGLQQAAQKQQAGQLTPFALLQLLCHTLEMRPRLRVKTKEHDFIQTRFLEAYDELLEKEPQAYDPEYEEFFNSIKTAMCLEAWANEKDEEYLLETFGITPGELHGKLERIDWLVYGCEELAKIVKFQPLLHTLAKLRVRLQHGVKEELLPLLQLKGIGRVRARRLYRNNIKDLGDVKKTTAGDLAAVLGNKVALDVKKQLGEEVKEVPERKRKGQVSVKDFVE